MKNDDAGLALALTTILQQTSFAQGEEMVVQAEVQNSGDEEVVLSYLVPFTMQLELHAVSVTDAPVFLNSQSTGGIPVGWRTLLLAGGAAEVFARETVHFRPVQRDDSPLSGYYADTDAGHYELTVTVEFYQEDGVSWSGVLRSAPVAITLR